MDKKIELKTSEFHRPNTRSQDFQLSGECADDANLVTTPSKWSVLTSCRWVLAYICFYAMILLFAMRASFVMALVCMFPEEPDLEIEEELNAEKNARNLSLYLSFDEPDNHTFLPVLNRSKVIIWDDKTQGFALSAYNYGYIISPVIGGYIALHSAKYVLMASMVLSAIATVLTPWSVGFSPYMTFVLRAIVGICGGVCVPAIQELWSKWAPKSERGKLTSFTHSGKMLGNVLSFGLTGILCTFDFLGGWPIAFYGTGVLSVIWLGLTLYCVHDTPEKHPRITENEREYIQDGVSVKHVKSDKQPKLKPCWGKILRSLPVWAVLICKLCSAYGLAVQVTNMPMWIRDVLKMDVKENGLFSALPYIGQFIGSIFAGIILDAIGRTPCSVTVVRKITFATCLLLPGSAILCLAFLGEKHKAVAILLTVVAATTYSAVPVSIRIIIIEIAPKYAGVLLGLTMTVGSIPGIIAPVVTSVITSRGTIDEWDDVFFMVGGFYALAALVFVIFGSAKEQPWAKTSTENEIVIEVDDDIRPTGLDNPGFYTREIELDKIAAASDNSSDSGVWMGGKLDDLKTTDNESMCLEMPITNLSDSDITGFANNDFMPGGMNLNDLNESETQDMVDNRETIASTENVSKAFSSLDDKNVYKHTGDDLYICHL